MSAEISKLSPGLSYNDFRSTMKGSGNSPSQLSEKWKEYKSSDTESTNRSRSPRRSPKRSSTRSPVVTKAVIRTPSKTAKTPRGSNIGPDGKSMSPPRSKSALTPKKKDLKPVKLFLESNDAVALAAWLPVKKLFQVLAASPDLKRSLDLKFWVDKYRKTFGYTQEFMMTKSTSPDDWMKLVRSSAIKCGMF